MSTNGREEIIFALLEKKFADNSSLGIHEQFEQRLELYQLSEDDLGAVVREEGFADKEQLLALYGRQGLRSESDQKEIEFISALQYLPDSQLAKIVNWGDLKTIHDHLYDFYISSDSGATYRDFFDKKLVLLMLEYHKKSEEVFEYLIRHEFEDSNASSLKELVDTEPGAKESCVDYVWDNGVTGSSGQDLSIDFMVFALKKISSDHARLTSRLSKTLLNSIDPDQQLIEDFSCGGSEQDVASDDIPDMPSDLIAGSVTRDQLINAMVNEWIVDCYCAPDEGDDPPEVKRREFEAMPNMALLRQLDFDDDYTIEDYMEQYSQIAEGYMKVFDSSVDDLQNASQKERSIIARVVKALREFKGRF